MGDEGAAVPWFAVRGPHDLPDLDPVALRKRVVAFVVRGHGHDRARAVLHQDVVRDPDRNRLAVDGIDRMSAGEDAVLLLPLPLDGGAGSRMTNVLAHLLGVGERGDERML